MSMTSPARRRSAAFTLLLAAFAIASCRTEPITGRNQLIIISEEKELALGASAYQEVLATNQLSTDARLTGLVRRVGERIAPVTHEPDLPWETNLLQSDEMNAFCLPGGKIAFYTGILPVCENEAGVAVVMGHEIAHAIAHHGVERMTSGMIAQIGGTLVGAATENTEAQGLVLAAYGGVANVAGLLPHSRSQEAAADHIGLIYMAKAGYDPREAPRFWQRFASIKGGDGPPEFLSTHPADATRIKNLETLLPEAIAEYEKAPVKHGLGEKL